MCARLQNEQRDEMKKTTSTTLLWRFACPLETLGQDESHDWRLEHTLYYRRHGMEQAVFPHRYFKECPLKSGGKSRIQAQIENF
ncbi:uncharacterized [Tachysurus ichikawai]